MNQMTTRNFALDTLRGFAAIGILVWHYQNFFSINGTFEQPFQNELAMLYKHGFVMVDFFFCLSGFIFYQKYSSSISSQSISFRDFIVLRLTRLYPLIFVTLIVTCILNYFLLYNTGKFFIYQENDLLNFLLNLAFLQHGFFKVGFSFNAPSWSIGIEFWLYVLFFFTALNAKKNLPYVTWLLAITFLSLSNNGTRLGVFVFNEAFERGISDFFIGGMVYYLATTIEKKSSKFKNIIGLAVFSISIVTLSLCSLKHSNEPHPLIGHLMVHEDLALLLVAFPGMVFAFSVSPLLESLLSRKIFKFFGDISYSSYLWHVPIQLLIITVVVTCDLSLNLGSKKFFISYILLVIVISYASCNFFEKPIQSYYRKRLLNIDRSI
jgi:peptidoglycan/LPS O-acetylase OafA/YrhL